MHPRGLRCSFLEYCWIFSVVAPCPPGASRVSVPRHDGHHGLLAMADPRVVHVEVNGQRYPIRSALDPSYVQELAIYVDRKMRVAFDSAPSTDALGLAILAALNIADEYFRARDSQMQTDGTLAARAGELERIVDRALAMVAAPPDA